MNAKKTAQKLLSSAGVEINGKNPWDMQVSDERLYGRIFSSGSLGLGEAYMDGWWDAKQLDEFFNRVLKYGLDKEVGPWWWKLFRRALFSLINYQSEARAFMVGKRHYDIGNDLYKEMLDKRLTYTCGYWKIAANMDQAQEAKLDLVCRKLHLEPGQKILDIGSGWGSFAKFAAEKYGAEVVGITVSGEQMELAEELCRGLPVRFELKDYRDVGGQFDHIVSLGMFEHVGYKNYRTFMKIVRRCLKDRGLFLLHTIGTNNLEPGADPWIDKYIFPNGMLPSKKQIVAAVKDVFKVEDWHNFGPDYDRTLMAWFENFDWAWPKLKERYGERFYRMWKYYLLSSAGSFRSGRNELWQIVLSKKGVPDGYKSVR